MYLLVLCVLISSAGESRLIINFVMRIKSEQYLPSSCPNEVDSSLLLSKAASIVAICVSFVFVSFSRS